jgi:hypothetical protein
LKSWSTNLSVRTQISAFLAGSFFAVILIFITQEDMRTSCLNADIHAVLTMISLTLTFVGFAFSTFAFGLSADFFRVSDDEAVPSLEKRAKTSFSVGGDFFKVGYFFMMWSLVFVLAYTHWMISLFGFVVFVGMWVYLWKKTGPYESEEEK